MPRSVWKGPFFQAILLKRVQDWWKLPEKMRRPIPVYSRASTILPDFLNVSFGVHNGMKFVPVVVKEAMVGHKFGEYSLTRKPPSFPLLKSQQSSKVQKEMAATKAKVAAKK